MTAAEIAAALGAARRAGQWWSCRCPAHDDRTPSLSLRDGDRGIIIRCWAGCDPRDVLAVLRRRRLVGGDGNARRDLPKNHRDDDRDGSARRIEAARRVWQAARKAPGSPVVRYLAGRSIIIPVPPSVRWAPALPRPDGARGPAMIARIDNVDGELIGIHRTWLDQGLEGRWRRRDRAMLGRAAGGAVRLAPAGALLGIAEGLENALAVLQATGMPMWAALSTAGLVSLILPPIVRTVVICADHDVNDAGERAARLAADRWSFIEGRRVWIAVPPEPGTDMSDLLAGRSCVRIEKARDVAA